MNAIEVGQVGGELSSSPVALMPPLRPSGFPRILPWDDDCQKPYVASVHCRNGTSSRVLGEPGCQTNSVQKPLTRLSGMLQQFDSIVAS